MATDKNHSKRKRNNNTKSPTKVTRRRTVNQDATSERPPVLMQLAALLTAGAQFVKAVAFALGKVLAVVTLVTAFSCNPHRPQTPPSSVTATPSTVTWAARGAMQVLLAEPLG